MGISSVGGRFCNCEPQLSCPVTGSRGIEYSAWMYARSMHREWAHTHLFELMLVDGRPGNVWLQANWRDESGLGGENNKATFPLRRILRVRCRVISCLRTESRNRFIRNAVDKIEDARFPNFNKAQQSSTSGSHLIETEAIENRAFSREA